MSNNTNTMYISGGSIREVLRQVAIQVNYFNVKSINITLHTTKQGHPHWQAEIEYYL